MPLFLLDGLSHCNCPRLMAAEFWTAGLAGIFCMDLLPVTPSASVSCRLVPELCLQLTFFTFPLISLSAEKSKSSHRGKGCHTYYIYQNYKLFITARFKGSSVISPTASQRSWSLQRKTLLLGEVFLLGNGRRSWAWEGQMESLDLIWQEQWSGQQIIPQMLLMVRWLKIKAATRFLLRNGIISLDSP